MVAFGLSYRIALVPAAVGASHGLQAIVRGGHDCHGHRQFGHRIGPCIRGVWRVGIRRGPAQPDGFGPVLLDDEAPRPEGLWGRWQWTDLREMLAYGGRSTVFNWFNYAATKADTVLVVAQANPAAEGGWTATGLYDRSAHLMSLPITIWENSVTAFSSACLPADRNAGAATCGFRGIALIAWLVIPGSRRLPGLLPRAVLLLGADTQMRPDRAHLVHWGLRFVHLLSWRMPWCVPPTSSSPPLPSKCLPHGAHPDHLQHPRSGGGLEGSLGGHRAPSFNSWVYAWLGRALQWHRAAAFRATPRGWGR